MTQFWGISEKGVPNVRTFSPHPRAAMVNWLCVTLHVVVTDDVPDERIRSAFLHYKGDYEAELILLSYIVVDPSVDAATVTLAPEGE